MILFAYCFACGFVLGVGVGALQFALAVSHQEEPSEGIHDDRT